jgi:hypothetical protein
MTTTTNTTNTDDPAWMVGAACAQPAHSGLPWLADTDQVTTKDTVSMAGVCEGCPVQAGCATYVADTDVTGGFWSGTDRLPSGWLTDTAHDAHAAHDGEQVFSWVPRGSRRGQQWEQAALTLGVA